MSLGREDILRELELLPVWRLRTPVAEVEMPGIAMTATVETVTEALHEKNAEDVLPQAETVPEPASLTEIQPAPLTVENAPLNIISGQLIQSPWFIACPQVNDSAAQTLLENIVRALKLPPAELHISHDAVTIAQVTSQFGILFGLETANALMGTNHADLASIRGQLLTHGDMRYVVTHHPHAMLENPLLKKEVWHDLCLLLAEK